MSEYPQIGPRKVPVEIARRELFKILVDWSDRHELTPLEELALLAEAQADVAQQFVKMEREGKGE